jgi:hypothetical protein
MPLTLQNSEEQAMFDAMIVAGWDILEGEHACCLKSPSGIMFAVEKHQGMRPLIYDVFDQFLRYNYFR